jgi:hypothetical protein
MRDADRCFWHNPATADELAEAQRLGGLRRKRERTLSAAYDLAGLDDIGAVRRVLEIAVLDTLGLDDSVARSRVLAGAAQPPQSSSRRSGRRAGGAVRRGWKDGSGWHIPPTHR